MRESLFAGHRRRLAGVSLGLLVLGFWALRFAGEGVPALDLFLYFYPVYEATYSRLAAGVLPLWNPYQLCGIPWLAPLQGGVFYPFHGLYLLLPLHTGLGVSHVLHLLLIAFSMLAFCRRAGLADAAAVLAAVLFTLRGIIPASLASTNYLEAAAWLPLGALAVLELARSQKARGAALLAVVTALSALAGYPQPTVYIVYVWATLLGALLLGQQANLGCWLTTGLRFGGALALGLLAAAIQLAPSYELVHLGAHRDLPLEVMQPFGAIHPLNLSRAIAGDPLGWGVTALALTIVALLAPRQRALGWWAVALAALTATFSLGSNTPLFRLYQALPLLGSFRFPDRMLGMTDFAVALAAAVGLDAVLSRASQSSTRWRRAPSAALLAIVLLYVVDQRLYVGGLVAVGGMILLLPLLWPRAPSGLIGAGLVLLATVEILFIRWPYRVPYTDAAVTAYRRYQLEYRTIATRAGADRVWFYGGLASLTPQLALKLATRYQVRALDDYEPLNPRRQAEYFSYLADGPAYTRRPLALFTGSIGLLPSAPDAAPLATRRRLLDLAALRFLVVPAGSPAAHPELGALIAGAGLEPRPFVGQGLWLFENPHALPRAFVVYRTRPAPSTDELLAAISQEAFDPLRESYVEDGPGFAPAGDAPERGAAVDIVHDGERVVEVDATLLRPGLVVLGDAFYPGWRATIDGEPAPILATNHLFRGVPTPAGEHRIRFEYRPLSVGLGAIGSLLGWLGIVVLVYRTRRRT